MPLMFDYECLKCGEQGERLVYKPDESVICKCGENMIKKVNAPGMLKTNFHDKTWIRNRKIDK